MTLWASAASGAVLETAKQWPVGSILRVCYVDTLSEIPPTLPAIIENAALQWSEHANITFDFGDRPATPCPADEYFEVRISVGHIGFWSFVGTDSVEVEFLGPQEASLNIGAGPEPLDSDYVLSGVLNTFGHVLGLVNEHQSPLGDCDEEFRWEDGPDGLPGVYSLLGGEPYHFMKDRIDQLLRQLPEGSYSTASYDPASVMHPSFPESYYLRGARSPCYTPPNIELSEGDKLAIASFYPREPGAIVVPGRIRVRSVREQLRAAGMLENDTFRGQLVRRYTGDGMAEKEHALREAQAVLSKAIAEAKAEPPGGFEPVIACLEGGLSSCREPAEDMLRSLPREASLILAAIALGEEDPVSGTRYIWAVAEGGSAVGEYLLALFLEFGLGGLPSAPDEAALRYRRAAAQAMPQAMMALATQALQNPAAQESHDEAVEFLESAAGKGLAVAQQRLAIIYDQGLYGLPKDPEKALELARLAALQGDPWASLLTGLLFLDGRTKDGSVEEARSWLERSAAGGHATAQASLGFLDEEGYLSTSNLETPAQPVFESALEWYIQAAEAGHTTAQFKVAEFFAAGKGTSIDPIVSADWMGRAAHGGHALAQLEFGRLNRDGVTVTADQVAAHVWLNLASFWLQGEPAENAARERDAVSQRLSENEWARALREAADMASPLPLTHLASAYAQPAARPKPKGSGTVIGANHILTNHHVIDDCQNPIGWVDGTSMTLEVGPTDPTNDLAALIAESNLSSSLPLRHFLDDPLDEGQEVFLSGYPFADLESEDSGSRLASFVSGHIEKEAGVRTNTDHFQHSATTNEGNSGGPVVDSSGNLVGIAVSKLAGESVEGVFFAIKPSVISEFLRTHDILPELQQRLSGRLPIEDLTSLAKRAAALISCQAPGAPEPALMAHAGR